MDYPRLPSGVSGRRDRITIPAHGGLAIQVHFVSVQDLSNESLLRFYEHVRMQVIADKAHGQNFMSGDSVKQYAESIRAELIRRGVNVSRIDW
jgi:hypothetical protein